MFHMLKEQHKVKGQLKYPPLYTVLIHLTEDITVASLQVVSLCRVMKFW